MVRLRGYIEGVTKEFDLPHKLCDFVELNFPESRESQAVIKCI